MPHSEMTAELSAEHRRLIEGYLAKTEKAAGLWRMIVGAHGAGVAWEHIGWLAEGYKVPEEVVEALLTGLIVIDPDGHSLDRLQSEDDPWSAFRAIGIDVPRPAPPLVRREASLTASGTNTLVAMNRLSVISCEATVSSPCCWTASRTLSAEESWTS
jgi:hypothetical protein